MPILPARFMAEFTRYGTMVHKCALPVRLIMEPTGSAKVQIPWRRPVLTSDSFSPEINVAANGHIFIVWIAGSTIKMLVSTNGGDSFTLATPAATGVTTLSSSLGTAGGGWPVFPGGNFRVLTVPTACVIGDTVVVAWDDFREGVSRGILLRPVNNGGSYMDYPARTATFVDWKPAGKSSTFSHKLSRTLGGHYRLRLLSPVWS